MEWHDCDWCDGTGTLDLADYGDNGQHCPNCEGRGGWWERSAVLAPDGPDRRGCGAETVFAILLLAVLLTLSVWSHRGVSRSYANPAYDVSQMR